MIDGANTCARPECQQMFVRRTHNQIYCSDICCRKATNAKIMIKYYEDKLLRSGKPRYCGCGAILSKYNFTKHCSSCESAKLDDEIRDVMDVLSVVVWD